MLERILFVDDEPKVLDAYRRTLRKSFAVVTAQSAREALRLLESEGPFPVIVSDMQMPEINGVELLTAVKKKYPDTVRLMLTGNSDQKTAVSAINSSDVYRFLNKPCTPENMASAIRAALSHYNLIKAEHKLLEDTVKGSIKALVEILSIVNPKIFGHASTIRNYVVKCADALNITSKWELEAAALLGQIGTVTLPDTMLERVLKGSPLSEDESSLYEKHPETAAQLINKIPRLEGISRTILYQNKGYDGSGKPDDGTAGADIPFGARLLKPVMDLVAGEAAGLSSEEAWARLQLNSKLYDPEILKVIERVIANASEKTIREISVMQLRENMTIASDVVTSTGTLLVKKGQAISHSMVARLINFSRNSLISDKVNVLVDKAK